MTRREIQDDNRLEDFRLLQALKQQQATSTLREIWLISGRGTGNWTQENLRL